MAPLILHASCVDLDGKGVLITGPAGAGKSTLALGLMSHGATLVADDQVALVREVDTLIATRPVTLPALIEVRGIGLLHACMAARTALALVVDLDRAETDRLPPDRDVSYLGLTLPLLYKAAHLHFGFAVAQLLRHGRSI